MNQAIETRRSHTEFPATPSQQRLWTLEHAHGDAVSRNIAVQWELQGRFADASVEAAFQSVIDRHEILRTAFEMRGGMLWQRVVDQVRFRLGSIDLRSVPQPDHEARIRRIAEDLAGVPFDMAAPGQIRACLVRFAPDRAALLIATHYGVFDGYSIRVLGREIGTLIAAAETGVPAALPDLPLQFGDYADWRSACEKSGAHEESRRYWHDRLDRKAYFEVPTDRPRQLGVPRSGSTLKLPLPEAFSSELDRAAKAAASSAFALGAAVMAAALHAVTGRAEVGFTTCVAGREEAEVENLIGVFVNPVVLLFDCAGASVADLIGVARRTVAEALAHGDYPFDALADALDQPLDPAKTPFVAPFFSLQSVFVEEQDYGPLRIVSVPSHTPQVTHDLAVQVIGRSSGWHMIVDYDTGLYDRATVLRFAELVRTGFVAAFERPDTHAGLLAASSTGPVAANQPAAPSPREEALPGPVHRLTPQTFDQVADIWNEVIGVAPEGPATDFFDLGGNSLDALRMLSKLDATLGVRISVAEFFDDPSLGGLACKIDALLGAPEPVGDARIWRVIELGRAPAPAPLVVSLNQPFLYHGMARELRGEAAFLNLHVQDCWVLDGPPPRVLRTLVEDAASRIISQAAGRQLVMIGHCVDGILALLVARRLAQLGTRPDLVAMIDCWKPGSDAGLSPIRLRLRRLQVKARRWTQNFRQLGRGEIGWTEFLSRNKLSRPLLERLGRIEAPTEAEREEWAVNAQLVRIARNIPADPYRGEVLLFSTAGQSRDARPRRFGWGDLLPADTPIHDLPGWHEYALKSDGVKKISAILSCRLGRGAARSSRD